MRSFLFLVLLALLGVLAWQGLAARRGAGVEVAAEADDLVAAGRLEELARARRSCRVEDLDAFLAAQHEIVAAAPEDGGRWAVLAEAYLERIYTRDLARALRPGEPTHTSLPPELAADVEAGLEACERALALGEDTADLWRVRMGLLSARVTGVASALAGRGEVDAALARAIELDAAHPRVQVAVGLRKLFAPRLLGRNIEEARTHLLAGAAELPLDERPLVFAALAAHCAGEDDEAARLLREALALTPAHPLARAALVRLEAGEADPFGRDADSPAQE